MKGISLILCFVFCVFAGMAQENATATISDEGKIVLSQSSEVHNTYELKVSMDDFESDEAAAKYFQSLNSEIVTYRVNYGEGKVYAVLNQRRRPFWSVDDWNEHFSSITFVQDL